MRTVTPKNSQETNNATWCYKRKSLGGGGKLPRTLKMKNGDSAVTLHAKQRVNR